MEPDDAWDLRYLSDLRCYTRNGGQLYYEIRGSGPPVICLNNFFIVAPIWRSFTATLAKQHTVISYDLQNQGGSSETTADFDFGEHCADLLDLMDHLALPAATLLGTSISTLICRDFARLHPDRVSSLVLVGPAFSPYGSLRLQLMLRDWQKRVRRGGVAAMFDYLYPVVFADSAIESGGRSTYLGLREHFLALNSRTQIENYLTSALNVDNDPGLLKEVAAPTLLVLGDGDYLWTGRTAEDTIALMPDASLLMIRDAGHMPFVERTEEFENSVAEFLDGLHDR